jgi:polyisoprenoid-binding protein YceI
MRELLGISPIGLVAVLGLTAGAGTPATDWNVDPAHSEVNFSVRHFFTPVRGTFHDFDLELDYDESNPEATTVVLTIGVASIDTKNERRDNHLRSADWFEAETHPTITFRSTSIRRVDGNRFVASGDLTIKDVTKRVELPVTLLGVQDVPEEMSEMLGGISKVASFQAESQLDRRDYGVGVGNWAETAVVGADVEIEIIVEANRK